MDLKPHIREIPDWPVAGVNFKDITTLIGEPEVFGVVIDGLAEPYRKRRIDMVIGIEARGFLLAAPVAYALGCGLAIVRKPGKLPYRTITESYGKEYGPDTLCMHEDAVHPGQTCIIIDDLMATGGTVGAAGKLVARSGGKVCGVSVVIDLPFLGGSRTVAPVPFHCLTSYDGE